MKKVFIAGTFDIPHPGHINLIKQAQSLGDFLVVAIARDQNVIKVKGQPPYFNEEQRFKNLNQLLKPLNLAGKIILGDLNDPYKNIRLERPDIVALGYDQQTYVNGLRELVLNSDLHFKVERLEPFKKDICKGRNVRKAVEGNQSGFLLIDKPMDWTSHDAVAKLRSITGVKQIGHTGTLDPFATGLLICAVSQATKMVGLFDVLPKTYEATVKFGVTSDTYDRTGQISNFQFPISNQSQISNFQLQNILNSFNGKQEQAPPMFSAKKVGGKKLYELARKGKEAERKMSDIEIYKIELLKSKIEDRKSTFDIKVICSTGTYIRTLAHDIGQKLGTGALLEELKRTAIGDFDVSQAVQLNKLTKDNYLKYLIKPLEAINPLNLSYARNV